MRCGLKCPQISFLAYSSKENETIVVTGEIRRIFDIKIIAAHRLHKPRLLIFTEN